MNEILFSSGHELGNVVVSSGILQHTWDANLKLDESMLCSSSSLIYKSFKHSKCTIIAFATSSSIQNVEKDLVPSSDQDVKIFDFLCTEDNPSFSLDKAAVDIFTSNYDDLMTLKSQVVDCNRLVITGKSLGGSVAALFSLLMLNSYNPSSKDMKLPCCVTFGSPLIGDIGLQEIISKSSPWDSCFLHVVSLNDPVPKISIPADTKDSVYRPFGNFLLCSDRGCACFNDPEVVLELLMKTSPLSGENYNCDYGKIITRLEQMLLFKDNSELTETSEWVMGPLQTSIVSQIKGTGTEVNMEAVFTKREKKLKFQSSKAYKITTNANDRLNDIKINMAHLEWYKKKARNGYYDKFKHQAARCDQDVFKYKRSLNIYWKEIVAEAERMPQAFRTRYLYGGTNYRRMVEPLDIAEYYGNGKKNYLTEGRYSEEYKHYKSLEQMLKDSNKVPKSQSDRRKQNVSSILTEDSCFWAHVEEAIILCETLKSGQVNADEEKKLRSELVKFEEYVMESIKNYAVNPEIFLKDSSFMKWWKEYEPIARNSHNLSHFPLTKFMKGDYEKYIIGKY